MEIFFNPFNDYKILEIFFLSMGIRTNLYLQVLKLIIMKVFSNDQINNYII